MPEKNQMGKGPEKRHFIHEKIVKPKLTRFQILRRLLLLGCGAVLFGFLAAVTFAVSEPWAKKFLAVPETTESSSVSIPTDEPETTPAPTTTAPPKETKEEESETAPIEEVIRNEMERYPFGAEDLLSMYGGFNELVQDTNKGIVTIHSVKTQTDWFDNSVEIAGQYAGAVIAATPEEFFVLTPREAVSDAETIEVTLSDGSPALAQLKGVDKVSDMAVLRVDISTLEYSAKEGIKVLELGNSYAVKPGDLIFTAGAPAGMIFSNSIGTVSYVAKNVAVVDGNSRLFYTEASGQADQGTFLFNTKGQVIGWVTDDYHAEGDSMTVVRALSDYKSVLEKLSNGITAPYLGIMGQEVPESKRQEGMPLGIYISRAIADGPAYNAGIQSGDILTKLGENSIVTMRDFQNYLDKLKTGENVIVQIQRFDREEYVEMEYEVTVGAR